MKYWEDKPITFKHFYHFPAIAASAGYDFNYFDVLSMNTRLPDEIVKDLFRVIVLLMYFTTFPVIGYFVYRYLKRIPKNENRHEILKMCYVVENKL